MKLYVCYGTFTRAPRPGGHPCGNAHSALKQAGHKPKVIRAYGLGALPGAANATRGRREVKELTGNYWVPVLVTDDGAVIQGSKEIIRWAEENPVASTVAD
jgi:Glutathione S-transferase, N-terminal domain